MNTKQSNKAVEFDGQCAFALSTGKKDVKGGKPSLTIDGKTYLFSNPVAKMLFRLLPNRLEKANQTFGNK